MVYNSNSFLSPEANKAVEEARQRNLYHSSKCHACGHQQREHGKYKCFSPNCSCRGGFHAYSEAEERANDRHYSEVCQCGHQRRTHDAMMCFSPGCSCRGGFHHIKQDAVLLPHA